MIILKYMFVYFMGKNIGLYGLDFPSIDIPQIAFD